MTYQVDHKINGEHVGRTVVEAESPLQALCIYVEEYLDPWAMSPLIGVWDGKRWVFRSNDHALSAEPMMKVAA